MYDWFLTKYNYLHSVMLGHYCKLCGIPDASLICKICYSELEQLPQNCCQKCKKPLLNGKLYCNDCTHQTIYYDKLHCHYNYAKPLSKVLHDFKYKRNKRYTKTLGQLLYHSIAENITNYDLIIPMPLHKYKLKQRGFNQVEKLLDYMKTQNKHLPINIKIVTRIKNTQSQALTLLHDRKNNLADAFKLNNQIVGLNILIVDDVVTTGATINELAKLLKLNGANTVDACCLMRAI